MFGRIVENLDHDAFSILVARIVLVAAAAFVVYHALVIFNPGYAPIERLMGIGLFFAELFFAVTGAGYATWVARSKRRQSSGDRFFTQDSTATVACLIPVRDEPIAIIEETLASVCALQYENKRVYVLDDSTDPLNVEQVSRLADTYGAAVIRRQSREHFKAGNLNHALRLIDAQYIAVFDSDQRPKRSFLLDLVPMLEENKQLAFVQTPQKYSNTWSPIAAAASLQNSLFYEYVAEGKDLVGAMFCCGTNFLMRRQALDEVGGFDVNTLTEDFATTLKLHALGWQTKFCGTLYVVGLGPEALSSYFKQHLRWAIGTLQVLAAKLKLMRDNPKALTGHQWLEYWLSCSYYLSGFINFYLLLLPPAYILLGLNAVKADPFVYMGLFFILLASSWTLFLFTAWQRDYPLKTLVVVCARLEMCKFYIYTKALISVLTGRQATFKVTEKGATKRLSWWALAVPLTVLGLNALAALAGLVRMSTGWRWYVAINTLWSSYNVWMLSALIQYNNDSSEEQAAAFKLWRADLGVVPSPAPRMETD